MTTFELPGSVQRSTFMGYRSTRVSFLYWVGFEGPCIHPTDLGVGTSVYRRNREGRTHWTRIQRNRYFTQTTLLIHSIKIKYIRRVHRVSLYSQPPPIIVQYDVTGRRGDTEEKEDVWDMRLIFVLHTGTSTHGPGTSRVPHVTSGLDRHDRT